MGKLIKFTANSQTFYDYIAKPAQPGLAIIVIHEWRGLIGNINSVCHRFSVPVATLKEDLS
ncbi:MAG: hypothetical protein ACKVQS_03190 [Fimbriimonadaceae bacterium]